MRVYVDPKASSSLPREADVGGYLSHTVKGAASASPRSPYNPPPNDALSFSQTTTTLPLHQSYSCGTNMLAYLFHPTRPPDPSPEGAGGGPRLVPDYPPIPSPATTGLKSSPALPPSALPTPRWYLGRSHSELAVSLQRRGGGRLGGWLQVRSSPPSFPPTQHLTVSHVRQTRRR